MRCARDRELAEAVQPLARAIDEGRWSDARVLLAKLSERFGPNEPELLRLGSMIE